MFSIFVSVPELEIDGHHRVIIAQFAMVDDTLFKCDILTLFHLAFVYKKGLSVSCNLVNSNKRFDVYNERKKTFMHNIANIHREFTKLRGVFQSVYTENQGAARLAGRALDRKNQSLVLGAKKGAQSAFHGSNVFDQVWVFVTVHNNKSKVLLFLEVVIY